MEEKMLVEISLERYEQLLDIETRLQIAADLIEKGKSVSDETILRVLGHYKMIERADKIKRDYEEFLKRAKEMENGSSVSE